MSFRVPGYGNEIDSAGAGLLVAENESDTENSIIFVNENGAPLLFHIPKRDLQRKIYKPRIINHGGILTENEPNHTNGIILLSSNPIANQTSFKFEFVDECIARGLIVDLGNYRHQSVLSNRVDRSSKQPKTHVKFTDAKDEYILEQIRRNPRKRNSHAFFDQLAEHELLSEHSGNSIRSRYRAHLRSGLSYVYKTGADDELVLDQNRNPIRISLDEFPFTLKNRFTADDDYLLCTQILKYNRENTGVEFNPYGELTVPISFFGNFIRLKEAKGHTVNSWRDRFRKFISKYGVQNYIDYYEESIREGKTPEPITNKPDAELTSEFRELIGSNYARNNAANAGIERNDGALDEEISELKSSNIDDVLIEQDKRLETGKGRGNRRAKQTKPEKSVPAKERKRNAVIKANFESDPEPQLDSQLDSQLDTQLDSQSPISIRYLAKPLKFEDIINDNFFNYSNPHELIHRIYDELNDKHDSSFPSFFTRFKNLGFNYSLTSHIIMSTNGDVSRIKTFIEYFLSKLYGSVDTDGLSEELLSFLTVKNVNGIWNEEADALLDTAEENKLIKIYSEDQIRARKNFLKSVLSLN